MKIIHLFLDAFVFVVLVLIHLYGPARICDVTMSHTWICAKRYHINVTEIMAVFY